MLNVLFSLYSLLFCNYSALQESRIVKIINKYGSGTGFLVSIRNNKSYYATNLHVCSEIYKPTSFKLSNVKVETRSGRVIAAETKGYDERHDLCILSIDEVISSQPLRLSNTLPPKGSELTTLTQSQYGHRAAGLYKDYDVTKDKWTYSHDDSRIVEGHCVSGMSGSPIVYNDRVVGIVWGCSENTLYTSFIPVVHLSRLLKRLWTGI